MASDDQGFAYMHVGFGYVKKLTLTGSLIAQWRVPQNQGYGIAVGSDGNIFVGDDSHRVIEKFSPAGQHLLGTYS
jgi:streptogramin lyase